MFCARCGNQVGISDSECQVCSATLNAPGALRLIDPKLDPDFVPQLPGQEPEVAEPQPAEVAAEDGEEAAEDTEEFTESAAEDETAGSADEGAEVKPAETDDAAAEPENDSVEPEGDSSETEEADSEGKKSKLQATRENAKTKLAVFSDKFQTTFDEVRNPSTENLRRVEHSLGIERDRIPRQKLTAALIVLFLTIAVSGVLIAQLINLDKTLLPEGRLSKRTLSVAPEPSSTSTENKIPEGAKECDAGVWAGERTSCEQANAAAGMVAELSETKTITIPGTAENQSFELECTPGDTVVCAGTDEAQGLAVWVQK